MTGNDKEFREQLGKFRLDSGPAAASLSLPRSASPPPPPATATPALPPASTPPPSYHPPPVHHHSLDHAALARSKRVSTACDFCRKRKKKCDFRYPNCSACSRAGVRCTIPPPGPQVASASVPRDQLENLQKRVRWLEDVVRRRTGVAVADLATGAAVDGDGDGDGDPDWWYQVPSIVAGGHDASSRRSHDAGQHVQLPNVGEIFRDQLEHRRRRRRRPSVARPVAGRSPRILWLSSLEETERVAGRYFDSMGYQYPFLHRPDFMADVRRIWTGWTPSAEVHYSYHITVAIALLIAAPATDDPRPADFYRASQETLPGALQNEDLPAVRALLSLALYTLFATAGPSVWHVLGSAMRLATSLGLHKARPAASLVEEEMGKRAFWSLYNLDRLIAVTLGRPLGIADEDISVGLPREFNDDWTETPGTSSMTIPLQVMRLRRIFSRIYRYCAALPPVLFFSLQLLTRQCTTTNRRRRPNRSPTSSVATVRSSINGACPPLSSPRRSCIPPATTTTSTTPPSC